MWQQEFIWFFTIFHQEFRKHVTVQLMEIRIMLRLAMSDPVQAGETGRVHHAKRLHARR